MEKGRKVGCFGVKLRGGEKRGFEGFLGGGGAEPDGKEGLLEVEAGDGGERGFGAVSSAVKGGQGAIGVAHDDGIALLEFGIRELVKEGGGVGRGVTAGGGFGEAFGGGFHKALAGNERAFEGEVEGHGLVGAEDGGAIGGLKGFGDVEGEFV